MPGVGYTGPNQSHFTSRHFWEVGATNEQLRTGWLGRYLDRVGSPDNPLQGLSLDWRLQPALATAKMPVASIDGPDHYDFWTRNVWGDVEKRMLDTIGALGHLPHARRPRRSSRRPPPRASRHGCASSCSRSAQGRQARLHEPRRLPEGRRRVPAPAGRPRRDARRRPAAPRRRALRARDVRHARRPAAGARRRAEADRRLPARVPARPRGARPRRPRARPRLVGVRPAREGERLERHRPRRRRRRLPDRLARERDDDRRVPRASRSSTSTATCARPPTSAASTARCSRSGSAPTPRRSSRARASSRGRR